MPVRWKLLGLAGVAGVTATGVVVARRRREHHDYEPDEIRAKLRSRLGEPPAPAVVTPPAGEPAP